MKNTTDNIQNTNRGSNGGQTTISGASNPHKLRDSAQTMKLSPMMQEYCKTKEEYKDCILFYRLGDFYEMFFDDALLVSKELELTLTGKDCGLEERAPMCGIPFHAADTYINRLIERGHKVAICEQVEDCLLYTSIARRYLSAEFHGLQKGIYISS